MTYIHMGDESARVAGIGVDLLRPATGSVRIFLLGSPRVLVDGVDVSARIKYRKGFALLAILALEAGRRFSRDQLASLLWPDLASASGRTNLRQVLGNLATVLHHANAIERQVLQVNRDSVALRPCSVLHIDIQQLQSELLQPDLEHGKGRSSECTQAIAHNLPPRQLLEGFLLHDCEEFTHWLEEQRLHVEDKVLALLENRIQAAIADDRTDLAMQYAQQIECIAPLHEQNQVRLVRMLIAKGRADRALLQLDRFIARLRVELDMAPNADILKMREQLLQHRLPIDQPDGSDSAANADRGQAGKQLSALSVVCVLYTARDEMTVRRAMQMQTEVRARVARILRQHHGTLMESCGLNLFAWFADVEHLHGASAAAVQAARDINSAESQACAIRIGIYSDMVHTERAGTADTGMREMAELAMRLGLVANDAEIVVCGRTQSQQLLQGQALGERTFRGLHRQAKAFRLKTQAKSTRR